MTRSQLIEVIGDYLLIYKFPQEVMLGTSIFPNYLEFHEDHSSVVK